MKEKQAKFKFAYKKMDEKRADARMKERSGSYDSYTKPQYPIWKPVEGKNKIRVIPCPKALETDEDYGKLIHIHYDIGPDKNAYLSLKEHLKKPDPVAEERNRLSREGQDEAAKALRPGKRVLLWIIDRKEPEKGPQLLSAAFSLHQDILRVSKDDSGALLHHYDPEEGYDVLIERVGTGKKNTEYTPVLARKSTPLSDDEEQMQEWLKFVVDNPLEDTLNFFDYSHIEDVFAGGSAKKKKKDDDEDEDDKPKTRASKGRVQVEDEDEDEEEEKPKKKARPVDEDEDEEEVKSAKKSKKAVDEDEDEEEEEKPAVKKKKAPVEEEEEEEEPVVKKKKKPAEDEDDEEEEKPVVKKKKRQQIDEDEDDEEEEPVVKKKKAPDTDEDDEPVVKKKKKPAEDEDDED